ncbi:phenylalanine--tRNA ligase subunit alpha [candidate division WWE3 bacterium CG08_land_8_20_14_0_20_40_13]|uniref:phenylalanine--tRNA ligase n=1 Tax=candidate division WWE3 bacterium CG08_land_8_20_14_0_20_40_13 TaxID=1975084 RepID=A0A2H0XEH0_UNCKA|nr:MAG: phenylalanine--tRNA ligase subunit alpha [candidate division WWE3 bacterium CG08_land_8_20_14_0_20_40_13]
MAHDIAQLRDLLESQIKEVTTPESLQKIEAEFLGRTGHISNLISQIKNIAPENKRAYGENINQLKNYIRETLLAKGSTISSNNKTPLDLTIPGIRPQSGRLHPTTITINRLNYFFRYYGFSVTDGNEIVTNRINFELLNLPPDHPARDLQDSLYIEEPNILLRTHTSSVEVETMIKEKPPIRVVVPGRCFRNETANSTNGAVFYQYEGLYVDENVTMGNLKWILEKFAKFVYGDKIKTRFRAKYYPQVEPGAGFDVLCTFCGGEGCSVCKYRGYIELIGCGMVHPNALKKCGVDNLKYSGFAFGMGLDRIVMTTFNIPDIRVLYNGDLCLS